MNRLSSARVVPFLAATMATITVLVVPALATPSELFISEYVEGSSSNKALEIYNGTGADVTLTGVYSIQLFANGSSTRTATIPLDGVVADDDAFVLVRATADAALLGSADQTTTNFLYNGNDAVALVKDGVIVDVIGQVGFDPGAEWGTDDAGTADNTLRRKSSVQEGDPDGGDTFDPTLEWDAYPVDTFAGLGEHTTDSADTPPGPANTPPEAVDDQATTTEDADAIAVDVLANDSDLDDDSLSIEIFSQAEHGAVTATADRGQLLYEPDDDFFGADSFTYAISDGNGGADAAAVTVSVEPVNDDPVAVADTAALDEDGIVHLDVLKNDLDVDGDVLAITALDQAANGRAEVAHDRMSISYIPAPDFFGSDAFSYSVEDGHGGTDQARVSIVVRPVNDPPVANADEAATVSGTPVTIDVIANDTDVDGDRLFVASASEATGGSVVIDDDGTLTYSPRRSFTGTDSFSYSVSDGAGAQAFGTVSVEVAPAALRAGCRLEPTIAGTRRRDILVGTPGDDVIYAYRGSDIIIGAGGNDVICAGPGRDVVVAADGHDWIHAGRGRDVVWAGVGDNVVFGGSGRDTLLARGGDDRLDGGAGSDLCHADGGTDTRISCESGAG